MIHKRSFEEPHFIVAVIRTIRPEKRQNNLWGAYVAFEMAWRAHLMRHKVALRSCVCVCVYSLLAVFYAKNMSLCVYTN